MSDERTRTHLLIALRRTLRALCRLLIRVGVRFDEFSSIAKATYIECAIRDYKHPSIPSRPRISALTGLTLNQVSSYVDGESGTPSTDPTLSELLVEVLHKWHTVPEYGGPYGIPLELELDEPPNRCLRSLVSLLSPNANPDIILERLIRSGAVLRSGEKRFRPASRALMMPDPKSPTLIERFGTTLSRLAATLEYNLDSRHLKKLLDRRVVADRGLPVSSTPVFESYAKGKTEEFLVELDNWLSARSRDVMPLADTGDRVDAGVNVFLYVEPCVVNLQHCDIAVMPAATPNSKGRTP